MEACKRCGALVGANGFVKSCAVPQCQHDARLFNAEVVKITEAMSLEMVARISDNQLPSCFAVNRASLVAMAGMLMRALEQNQAMAERLRMVAAGSGDKPH